MKKLSVITLLFLGSVVPSMASEETNTVRIPGKVEGFPSMKVDNVVNGALVLKSFRPSDILQFRVEQFVAPNEPMKAGPKTINVPGNFFIPRQSENWGFFRISLEKSEYGYYTEPGSEEEIMATSFELPFSELVDLAQNGQASPSKLLPLVSLDRFDFKSNADHSAAQRVDFSLSGDFISGTNFTWNRDAAAQSESDHVFAFQETPESRWVLSDLIGNASNNGNIKRAEGMSLRQKFLFARLREENNKLKEIRAVVNEDALAEGLPMSISNARIEGDAILWDAPEGFGWMSVLTERKQASLLEGSMLWFFDLRAVFGMGKRVDHAWVQPADGSFVMMPPSDGEDPQAVSITLAFVGADREVAHPDQDPSSELFTYVNQISMQVLK